jgi:Ca-activated chloride channel family protein
MTRHVTMLGEHDLPTATDDAGIAALHTDRGNLPLDEIGLRAAITGLAVRTELTQSFRNPFTEPLEATYIFPLPDRSAVTALRMTAGDRVVEGVLKERGAARADYDRAVEEGRRASIAEEDRPGVFTMRVGNIMPGERVTVRLDLAGLLPYEDGDVTFRFPLVVAPRYIPGTPLPGASAGDGMAPDTDAVPDASRITPPVLLPGFPNPVRFTAVIDVDPAGLPLADARCSLPIDEEDDGRRLRVRPGQRLDRDLVLRLRLGAEDAITTSLVTGTETFVCTVLPPTVAVPARPRDVLLALDRSGSMAGWKIAAARRAAARIVDTLTSADRFAVVAFDHQLETPPDLPEQLVPATDRSRFRAVRHLADLEARGGTEMTLWVQAAARIFAAEDTGRDRVVVLITDGQVGDEDRLLRQAGPLFASTRIHTVGVDSAVNAGFLRRLAESSGGRCELVESEDRLDEAMSAIHRRIGAPLLTGLSVRGAGVDPGSLTPARLPDVFPGAPVVISGRFRGADPVTVSGDLAGEPWQVELTGQPSDNASLPAIWARSRVRDLEDRYVARSTSDLEREIVSVSLTYRVLSRFTAFVAVDDRVVNEGGTRHHVTQPVELPHGWAAPAPMAAAAPMGRARARVSSVQLVGRRPAFPVGRAGSAAAPAASLVPTSVLELATRTLRELGALAGESSDRRAEFLAALADEITRRIDEFRRDGLPEPGLRVLTDLAATLVAETDVDARWDRVTLALRPFIEPRRRAEFWKR